MMKLQTIPQTDGKHSSSKSVRDRIAPLKEEFTIENYENEEILMPPHLGRFPLSDVKFQPDRVLKAFGLSLPMLVP